MKVHLQIELYRRDRKGGEKLIDRTWFLTTDLPFLPRDGMTIVVESTATASRFAMLSNQERSTLFDSDTAGSLWLTLGEGYYDVPSQTYRSKARWWSSQAEIERAVLTLDAFQHLTQPNPFLPLPGWS